jgi:hypothetical protein
MTETEIPPSSEQPIYSGDVEGVKAAAEELQRKRGDTETADAVIGDDSDPKGPATDEKPLRVSEAAKEVANWREERAKKAAEFEKQVYGDAPDADEAWLKQLDEAKTAAEALDKVITAQEAEADKEIAAAEKRVAEAPQPPRQPVALRAVDEQLNNYVAGHTEQARQQIIAELTTRFPELGDAAWLNSVRTNDPARWNEIQEAWNQGEVGLQVFQQAKAFEAAQARGQLQEQWQAYAAPARPRVRAQASRASRSGREGEAVQRRD